jgi:protein-S-isoprenylcysteine O-methyltransferase Ste14
MAQLVIFLGGSVGLVVLSWHSLANPDRHGFPRFFAFEAILGLVVLNTGAWFDKPLSPLQLVSWILLLVSAILIISGVMALRKFGKPYATLQDPNRLTFEKTTQLVIHGPYQYIRHPMYASLLLLAWGVIFKQVSVLTVCLVSVATVMLYLTALLEERENMAYFGQSYQKYMETTKMFIPYIF